MTSKLLIALALLAAAAPIQAQAPIERLSRFADGLESIEGGFHQRVFNAHGELTEDSEGRIALARPRLFRWEYVTPFPQLIVADGSRIWIHDPDLEQVTVRRQDEEEQQSPLSVLIDPAALEARFALSDAGVDEGLDWIDLEPRETGAGFERARLGFATGELARMELFDGLGQRTVIDFHDWRRNPQLDAGHFRFVPPPDADVVGDVPEGALVYPID